MRNSSMLINTSRFGQLDIDPSRLLTFPKGLLGFSSFKRYALLETGADSYFWWLQSIEEPTLAFVVTDPSLFVSSYRVPIRPEQLREMGMESISQAQVLVIVNKRDQMLTGNLQGPLVINCLTRCGEQLVLSDRRFTTRVPLIELASPVQAMSA
ncbi:MAG: flagellar assembly protein FliW [Phycisphaeraceae bacterium]|nr:flagellar assembly protein FliW [Phycisphaeraceae bacterium]